MRSLRKYLPVRCKKGTRYPVLVKRLTGGYQRCETDDFEELRESLIYGKGILRDSEHLNEGSEERSGPISRRRGKGYTKGILKTLVVKELPLVCMFSSNVTCHTLIL